MLFGGGARSSVVPKSPPVAQEEIFADAMEAF